MKGHKWHHYVKNMAQQKDKVDMMAAKSTRSMQHIYTMACSWTVQLTGLSSPQED